MLPPIVTDPVREDGPVYSVHETFAADDEPLDGETLSHESLVQALQLPPHPAGEPVTDSDCDPAAALAFADVGEMVNEVHGVNDVERSKTLT